MPVTDIPRRPVVTVLTVFGTRPEVIKLAPVLRQLDLLIQADLVKVRAEGRERINTLHSEPLEEVCMPWLLARKQAWTDRLARLKQHVESKQEKQR